MVSNVQRLPHTSIQYSTCSGISTYWYMDNTGPIIGIYHYWGVLVKRRDQRTEDQSLLFVLEQVCSMTVYLDKIILVTTLASNWRDWRQEWSWFSWTYIPHISAWTSSLHFLSSWTFLCITLWGNSEPPVWMIDHWPYYDTVQRG